MRNQVNATFGPFKRGEVYSDADLQVLGFDPEALRRRLWVSAVKESKAKPAVEVPAEVVEPGAGE